MQEMLRVKSHHNEPGGPFQDAIHHGYQPSSHVWTLPALSKCRAIHSGLAEILLANIRCLLFVCVLPLEQLQPAGDAAS